MSKQGMMERLDWYLELRRLFSLISENNVALKSRLLQSLGENYLSFKLKPGKEYLESSVVQGFSYDDIWGHIENMPKSFSWDYLLNSFTYLEVQNKKEEAINLVQVKSTKKIEESKSPEKGTLKEDFPLVKFYNLTEINMNKNLKFLSLGGNLISNANYEFPAGLIVLNLSYNKITDFSPLKPLLNLKFLNLSHNLIENLQDISGILTVIELFLSSNKLPQANFLFSIKNMNLLDLGNNLIENFEDIALLCTSSMLQTLNLAGNPLNSKAGYKTSVRNVVTSLIYFDPPDTSLHSNFKLIGFSEPRKAEKPVSLESPTLNQDLNFRIFASFHQQNSVSSSDHTCKTVKASEKTSPVIVQRANTPKVKEGIDARHRRSKSNMPNGSLPTTPSLNNSRLETSNKRGRSIVINKSNTTKPMLKEFGNPISAMMIGPPAVSNIFKGNKARTMKFDMSKIKSSRNHN
jgi:hypothetical protein